MNPFNKSNKQISIYITAGFPTLDATIDQIISLQQQGIDFVEIGLPFSDPLADGPVIQQTSSIAIQNGMNIDLFFKQIEKRRDEITIPIVFMGYLNPVIQYGIERFFAKCKSLKFSGIILPDLSPELQDHLAIESEVPIIHLITPSTSNERISSIAKRCAKSFVYLVSSNATTGSEVNLNDERLKEIKSLCGPTPLMIGFGISTSKDVQQVHQIADGAIIGSAYLKAINEEKSYAFIEELIE